MALERYILTAENDPWEPKLNILYFRAMLDAYLFDGKSAEECENGIEWVLNQSGTPWVLTTNDKADIVNVLNYVNGGADDYEKMQRADSFYRILIAARATENSPVAGDWYATQDLLRAKLNWSSQD